MVTDLQDALGELRDLQVQLEAFAALERRVPRRGARASAEDRTASCGPRSRRTWLAVRKAIARWNKRGPRALRAAGVAAAARKAGRAPASGSGWCGELEALEERVIDAHQRPTPRPMHLLRIAVKRFRYALELLQPAMPDEVDGDRAGADPAPDRAGRPPRHRRAHRPDRPPHRRGHPGGGRPAAAPARRARATGADRAPGAGELGGGGDRPSGPRCS